jgi:hypothetical protein
MLMLRIALKKEKKNSRRTTEMLMLRIALIIYKAEKTVETMKYNSLIVFALKYSADTRRKP